MTTAVDRTLLTRFASFADALRWSSPEKLTAACHRSPSQGDFGSNICDIYCLNQLRAVDAAVHEGDLTVLHQAMMNLQQVLPPGLRQHIVIDCEEQANVAALVKELNHIGLDMREAQEWNRYFEVLGMYSIAVPPVPGVLGILRRMHGVRGLADGMLGVVQPIPLQPQLHEQAWGPRTALQRCMLGDTAWVFDDRLDDGCVRVGVIDTGIDEQHPAFRNRVECRIDVVGLGTGPVDPWGHGSHVAGIIGGAAPPDSPGWGGIAPSVHFVDIMLYSPYGVTIEHLIGALGASVVSGVDIINISMGTSDLPADGRSLISIALDRVCKRFKKIVCVAAGNSGERGPGGLAVPGDAASALTVAACTIEGAWAPFSSLGPSADPERTGLKPTLAAPGVNIVSVRSASSQMPPWAGRADYTAMSGTSMAAPMVAGVCAHAMGLMRTRRIECEEPEYILQALLDVCELPSDVASEQLGHGIPRVDDFVDALAAMKAKPTPTNSETERSDNTKEAKRRFSLQETAREVLTPVRRQNGIGNESVFPCGENDLIEEHFFADLPARLREHANEFLRNVLGDRVGECRLEIKMTDDRHGLAEKMLTSRGIHDWPDSQPRNRRYRGSFMQGSKAICDICVASLLGTYKLQQYGMTMNMAAVVEEHVNVLDRNNKAPWRKSNRLLVATLLPGNMGNHLLSLPGDRENTKCFYVFAGRTDDNGADAFPVYHNGSTNHWAWLVLAPGSLNEKTQRLIDFLDNNLEMEQIIDLKIVAEKLDYPIVFVQNVVESALKRDARFKAIERPGRVHAVKRVRMLNM